MYSYQPRAPKLLGNSRVSEGVSFRALGILALVFVLGLFVVRFMIQRAYIQTEKALANNLEIERLYGEKLAKQTNARERLQVANNLLSKKMPYYAALNFKRASDIDPNLRDASYGWGYALLQAKTDSLTSEDINQIKQAVARAEAVDPLYLPNLELKKLVAQIENNQSVADATIARIKLLQK